MSNGNSEEFQIFCDTLSFRLYEVFSSCATSHREEAFSASCWVLIFLGRKKEENFRGLVAISGPNGMQQAASIFMNVFHVYSFRKMLLQDMFSASEFIQKWTAQYLGENFPENFKMSYIKLVHLSHRMSTAVVCSFSNLVQTLCCTVKKDNFKCISVIIFQSKHFLQLIFKFREKLKSHRNSWSRGDLRLLPLIYEIAKLSSWII